jgi:hypothetical protein
VAEPQGEGVPNVDNISKVGLASYHGDSMKHQGSLMKYSDAVALIAQYTKSTIGSCPQVFHFQSR